MTATASSSSKGPRYAPPDPTLPKPWKGLIDGSTGYIYFWNPDTNVTQYERPVVAAAPAARTPPLAKPEQGSFCNQHSEVRSSSLSSNSYPLKASHESSASAVSMQNLKATARGDKPSDTGGNCSIEAYRRQHEITVIGDGVPEPFRTFQSTCFPSEILREVLQAGFSAPTPIQAQSWPITLQGRDIVAVAKTGSGKTLGYLLPGFIHLKQLRNNSKMGPTILVLSPTRELATQIQDEAVKFGRSSRISSVCLYGGAPKGPQLRDLDRGADVVVATPGRLNDILEMRRVSLHQISYLVLDEADRMLDMGFEPQIRKIVKEIPPRRQTLMFTATWPKEVRKIAADLLVSPVQVNIGSVDELVANKAITQYVDEVVHTVPEVCEKCPFRIQNRTMHLIIVGLLLMGSAANGSIFGNQNIVMTARCRAQCLNKFIAAATPDCQEDFDCLSCWNQCDELYRDANNNFWRQGCDNESLCATGCQESCRFYNSHSELIEATRTDTHFAQPLKYEVDERENGVHFYWAIPEGNDRIEPLVYVLTVSDGSFEQPLGQTDSNRWSVSRRILRMFSRLRLTAYDSNGKVAEMEIPLQELKLEQWTPSLNSLKIRRSPHDEDVDAYVSWPRFTDEDMTYQVQWRSSFNKLVTTGHLTTQENNAVLSLQPNAWFQMKVTARRTESPNVIAQSETILFFSNPHPTKELWNLKCAGSCVESRPLVAGIFVGVIAAAFIIGMIWKCASRSSGDSKCSLESVSVKSDKSPSILKPNFVWHVGSSPEYQIFQNRDNFTWSPPDLENLPKSVRI